MAVSRLKTDQVRRSVTALRERRRREAFQMLGGRCARCGSRDRLEFDHVNPAEKDGTIASMLTHRYETFREEVGKCQLLCHDCHLVKTKAEASERRKPHGTPACYTRGCREPECKEAMAAHRKSWPSRTV